MWVPRVRKQYRLAESHLIAVGTEGHDTPAGVYLSSTRRRT